LPYRLARACPQTLFVGIDANAEGLRETATRAARKPAKGGVENLVLVQAHAEDPPAELVARASRVTIYFPWASLLHAVVGANERGLAGLAALCREGATLEAVVSHDPARDGAMRAMPELSPSFFADELAGRYRAAGLELREAAAMTRADVRGLPTSWAKRLGFGVERSVWRVVAVRLPRASASANEREAGEQDEPSGASAG
jgi:16S rRNA (adenine(1408)-N(1))-methyltransferase